jgi:hypothetical protein
MEWVVVLAALACPIGMLAMGAIAWVVAKRAGRSSDATDAAKPGPDGSPRESAVSPG